eukprot:GHVP01056092.1.p1 GENE.GHVP01056092.1~~GHVP01056092.1.p1  ORF type:complete len:2176 (+),score=410.06 GHVP01056092.1:61-6588(+)
MKKESGVYVFLAQKAENHLRTGLTEVRKRHEKTRQYIEVALLRLVEFREKCLMDNNPSFGNIPSNEENSQPEIKGEDLKMAFPSRDLVTALLHFFELPSQTKTATGCFLAAFQCLLSPYCLMTSAALQKFIPIIQRLSNWPKADETIKLKLLQSLMLMLTTGELQLCNETVTRIFLSLLVFFPQPNNDKQKLASGTTGLTSSSTAALTSTASAVFQQLISKLGEESVAEIRPIKEDNAFYKGFNYKGADLQNPNKKVEYIPSVPVISIKPLKIECAVQTEMTAFVQDGDAKKATFLALFQFLCSYLIKHIQRIKNKPPTFFESEINRLSLSPASKESSYFSSLDALESPVTTIELISTFFFSQRSFILEDLDFNILSLQILWPCIIEILSADQNLDKDDTLSHQKFLPLIFPCLRIASLYVTDSDKELFNGKSLLIANVLHCISNSLISSAVLPETKDKQIILARKAAFLEFTRFICENPRLLSFLCGLKIPSHLRGDSQIVAISPSQKDFSSPIEPTFLDLVVTACTASCHEMLSAKNMPENPKDTWSASTEASLKKSSSSNLSAAAAAGPPNDASANIVILTPPTDEVSFSSFNGRLLAIFARKPFHVQSMKSEFEDSSHAVSPVYLASLSNACIMALISSFTSLLFDSISPEALIKGEDETKIYLCLRDVPKFKENVEIPEFVSVQLQEILERSWPSVLSCLSLVLAPSPSFLHSKSAPTELQPFFSQVLMQNCVDCFHSLFFLLGIFEISNGLESIMSLLVKIVTSSVTKQDKDDNDRIWGPRQLKAIQLILTLGRHHGNLFRGRCWLQCIEALSELYAVRQGRIKISPENSLSASNEESKVSSGQFDSFSTVLKAELAYMNDNLEALFAQNSQAIVTDEVLSLLLSGIVTKISESHNAAVAKIELRLQSQTSSKSSRSPQETSQRKTKAVIETGIQPRTLISALIGPQGASTENVDGFQTLPVLALETILLSNIIKNDHHRLSVIWPLLTPLIKIVHGEDQTKQATNICMQLTSVFVRTIVSIIEIQGISVKLDYFSTFFFLSSSRYPVVRVKSLIAFKSFLSKFEKVTNEDEKNKFNPMMLMVLCMNTYKVFGKFFIKALLRFSKTISSLEEPKFDSLFDFKSLEDRGVDLLKILKNLFDAFGMPLPSLDVLEGKKDSSDYNTPNSNYESTTEISNFSVDEAKILFSSLSTFIEWSKDHFHFMSGSLLISVAYCFAASPDIPENAAFVAIEMMWKLSDNLLSDKEETESPPSDLKQVPVFDVENVTNPICKILRNESDSLVVWGPSIILWKDVIFKLHLSALDLRNEVRNSSLKTLFSIISNSASSSKSEHWNECILFPLCSIIWTATNKILNYEEHGYTEMVILFHQQLVKFSTDFPFLDILPVIAVTLGTTSDILESQLENDNAALKASAITFLFDLLIANHTVAKRPQKFSTFLFSKRFLDGLTYKEESPGEIIVSIETLSIFQLSKFFCDKVTSRTIPEKLQSSLLHSLRRYIPKLTNSSPHFFYLLVQTCICLLANPSSYANKVLVKINTGEGQFEIPETKSMETFLPKLSDKDLDKLVSKCPKSDDYCQNLFRNILEKSRSTDNTLRMTLESDASIDPTDPNCLFELDSVQLLSRRYSTSSDVTATATDRHTPERALFLLSPNKTIRERSASLSGINPTTVPESETPLPIFFGVSSLNEFSCLLPPVENDGISPVWHRQPNQNMDLVLVSVPLSDSQKPLSLDQALLDLGNNHEVNFPPVPSNIPMPLPPLPSLDQYTGSLKWPEGYRRVGCLPALFTTTRRLGHTPYLYLEVLELLLAEMPAKFADLLPLVSRMVLRVCLSFDGSKVHLSRILVIARMLKTLVRLNRAVIYYHLWFGREDSSNSLLPIWFPCVTAIQFYLQSLIRHGEMSDVIVQSTGLWKIASESSLLITRDLLCLNPYQFSLNSKEKESYLRSVTSCIQSIDSIVALTEFFTSKENPDNTDRENIKQSQLLTTLCFEMMADEGLAFVSLQTREHREAVAAILYNLALMSHKSDQFFQTSITAFFFIQHLLELQKNDHDSQRLLLCTFIDLSKMIICAFALQEKNLNQRQLSRWRVVQLHSLLQKLLEIKCDPNLLPEAKTEKLCTLRNLAGGAAHILDLLPSLADCVMTKDVEIRNEVRKVLNFVGHSLGIENSNFGESQ